MNQSICLIQNYFNTPLHGVEICDVIYYIELIQNYLLSKVINIVILFIGGKVLNNIL